MNLHQHAKNQAFSSFCSRDIVDLKILQSDWLNAFWPISHEPDFSQVGDLCNNIAININFFTDQIQRKVMTKFSNKFKKPFFGSFWPFIGQKKIFLKIWLCQAQHHVGILHHAEFQKKLMSQSKENFWTVGLKEGHTLIQRTLPITAWGPKKKIILYAIIITRYRFSLMSAKLLTNLFICD